MSWQRNSRPRARPIRQISWTRVLFRNSTSPVTLIACISNYDVAKTNQFRYNALHHDSEIRYTEELMIRGSTNWKRKTSGLLIVVFVLGFLWTEAWAQMTEVNMGIAFVNARSEEHTSELQSLR